MLHSGFGPLLDTLKTAMEASTFNAGSAHLALALNFAEQGEALCGEDADRENLAAARGLARQCGDEIHAMSDSIRPGLSDSRRALSALFVELDERIASAAG